MAGPVGYEDAFQIGARPYLERVGGDMVGPITFQVSGATTPHLAAGTGFGPLVLGKAATATYATADTDVVIGDDFEVKGVSWLLGGARTGLIQSLLGNTPVTMQNTQGSGFSASDQYTRMFGRNTTNASTQSFRLTAGYSTATGAEAGPIGIFAGYNSTDVGRYAPVVIGAQPYIVPATYAALLTDQDDPLFAVFDREDPGSITDHYLYLQRSRAGAAPTQYYSLLASALGPVVIGDPAFNPAANPVFTSAVAMALVFRGNALETANLGLSSAVGEDLKLRAGTGLPVGGGATAALEAGGKRVRFGVFVDDDTVVHDGYIIIKDDAGTERWLGVVKTAD